MAHVLIPTDFSDNALNAAVYAVNLFGADGNTFTVLNAYAMPHGTAGNLVNLRPEMARAAAEGVERFVMALEKALPDHATGFRERCEHGDLRSVVARLEHEEDRPDVIVMGTQGATGLKRVLMGSNTADVLQHARTPVLAVPEQARYRPPQRIVLADDGNQVDKGTIELLLDIARWSRSEINIVHVLPEGQGNEEELNASGYDLVLGAIPHTYHSVSGDNVMVALHDLADQSDADLVVVIHRKRGVLEQLFHRSVATQLAMHTHIPMLILQQAGS
jgi:nucleotide-binding universal stress UspA family protein